MFTPRMSPTRLFTPLTFHRALLPLALLLASALSSCGPQACGTLPYCLTPPATEPQPSGVVRAPILLAAGASLTVTLDVDRSGLPANDPVTLVPTGSGSDPMLLARSAGGIEVRGSAEPFSTPQVPLRVTVPAGTPPGGYGLALKLRRVASTRADTSGPVNLYVQVQ